MLHEAGGRWGHLPLFATCRSCLSVGGHGNRPMTEGHAALRGGLAQETGGEKLRVEGAGSGGAGPRLPGAPERPPGTTEKNPDKLETEAHTELESGQKQYHTSDPC